MDSQLDGRFSVNGSPGSPADVRGSTKVPRSRSNSVVKKGARAAFAALERHGCGQCWCARVVEENYAWGARIVDFLPPTEADVEPLEPSIDRRRLPIAR